MKYQKKFIGKMILVNISGGNATPKFNPENISEFTEHSKSLVGEKVEVTVEKFKEYKERSNQQNRYWHGVICKILSAHNGDEALYWHKYLKVKFLLPKITGEPSDMDSIINSERFDEIANLLSTTDLGTIGFEWLASETRKYASKEFGVNIPLPNDVPFQS